MLKLTRPFGRRQTALFFLHIRSSMQAHGEIRCSYRTGSFVKLQGRHGHGSVPFGVLDFLQLLGLVSCELGMRLPSLPCEFGYWSRHPITSQLPIPQQSFLSTSLRKARRSSCRREHFLASRMKDDPQSELQFLNLHIGTRGYMGSA
jgi:hypothetical protein